MEWLRGERVSLAEESVEVHLQGIMKSGFGEMSKLEIIPKGQIGI